MNLLLGEFYTHRLRCQIQSKHKRVVKTDIFHRLDQKDQETPFYVDSKSPTMTIAKKTRVGILTISKAFLHTEERCQSGDILFPVLSISKKPRSLDKMTADSKREF